MSAHHTQLLGASIPELARRLEHGSTKARQLVELCLSRIEAADGEGARVFRTVDVAGARGAAESYLPPVVFDGGCGGCAGSGAARHPQAYS